MKKNVIFIVMILLSHVSFGQDIFNLSNDLIQIKIKKKGAELCAIKLLSNGKDYMWKGDPKIWGGISPVLFPIVGALKDRSYLLDGVKYSMQGHGFFRNSPLELVSSTNNSMTFMLKHSQETLIQYPFEFEFLITYTLKKNKIVVGYEVKNLGAKDMYFSLGAHPSFKCPIDSGEKYTDYYLEFEKDETAYTFPIGPNGLLGDKTDLILNNSRIINLNYHLFDKDALVFKTIKSKSVSLCSKISGKRVQVDFKGFPFLGFWAKPNADYVCIEPWYGVNDSVGTDQNFKTKEGIIKLKGNRSFKAAYSISIF
jgi:galactose mutarotase-like enzyme